MTRPEPLSDKALLRSRMRQVRAACAQAAPNAAEQAADALPLDGLAPFMVAAGYVAQGSELSPLPLLRRLAARGAATALPAAADRVGPLTFRAWREGEPLAADAFGVPSPLADARVVFPDLVIAPLLAFDRRGGRLGQGAGHYDRAIQALRAKGPVTVIGLAYAGQEIAAAPLEPHDQALDGVLTEAGYHSVRP